MACAAGCSISFGQAFSVGILITLITCACYVVTWEIMYFKLMPGFMEKYAHYLVEKSRASGATQQALDAQLQQLKQLKKMLDNPPINAVMTFAEIFPIGLLVTLISATILRKKRPAITAGASTEGRLSEA